MVAGAVVATVDDGSALYYNPSGLGNIDRDSVDVSASAYTIRFYTVPDYIRSSSGESEDASSTEFVTLPTQIAYTRLLTNSLVLGLGYFAPRGGDLLLRERFDFDDAEGSSSVAYDSRASTQEFFLSAGIGAEIVDGLRAGLSLHGTYESSVLSGAVFFGVGDGATDKAILFSELQTFDRIGLELGGGLQWDVGRQLTLAASFRSPRLHVTESRKSSADLVAGANTMNQEPVFFGSAAPSADAGSFRGFMTYGEYSVGASYRALATTIRAEVDLQPGITDVDLAIERSFGWGARAGVTHQLTGTLQLGAGVFSDQRSAKDNSVFYGGTVGLKISNEHLLADGEAADSLIFSSVFALRYAYGMTDSEHVTVDPSADLVGSFETGIEENALETHEIGLHVGSTLKF